MDRLVAAGAEDRRAEYLLRIGIGDHRHETLRLALLHRTADSRHRPGRDQQLPAARARLGLGHADPTERRVDVECVAEDPVGDPAVGAIEQVGGDNLIVVPGCMGECAATVAVAQRPHTGG